MLLKLKFMDIRNSKQYYFHFNGKMCELRTFSSTLTSTDISNLGSGLAPITNSSFHLKMNEGTGTNILDYIT